MENNMDVLLECIKTHKNSLNGHTLVYVKASKIIIHSKLIKFSLTIYLCIHEQFV